MIQTIEIKPLSQHTINLHFLMLFSPFCVAATFLALLLSLYIYCNCFCSWFFSTIYQVPDYLVGLLFVLLAVLTYFSHVINLFNLFMIYTTSYITDFVCLARLFTLIFMVFPLRYLTMKAPLFSFFWSMKTIYQFPLTVPLWIFDLPLPAQLSYSINLMDRLLLVFCLSSWYHLEPT